MSKKLQYKFFRPRRNFRSWLTLITIALLAHALFLIFFQPEYLDVFEKKNAGKLGDTSSDKYANFSGKHFLLVNTVQEERANDKKSPIIKIDDNNPEQSPDFNYDMPPIDLSLIRGIKGNSEGESGDSKNKKLSIKPNPILIPWPEYPENANKDYRGKVILNLYVNAKGEVEEVVLLRGLSIDSFNNKAIQAAKKINFTPGSVDGKAASMWVQISIEFQPRQ